jgi:hypothetical protein
MIGGPVDPDRLMWLLLLLIFGSWTVIKTFPMGMSIPAGLPAMSGGMGGMGGIGSMGGMGGIGSMGGMGGIGSMGGAMNPMMGGGMGGINPMMGGMGGMNPAISGFSPMMGGVGGMSPGLAGGNPMMGGVGGMSSGLAGGNPMMGGMNPTTSGVNSMFAPAGGGNPIMSALASGGSPLDSLTSFMSGAAPAKKKNVDAKMKDMPDQFLSFGGTPPWVKPPPKPKIKTVIQPIVIMRKTTPNIVYVGGKPYYSRPESEWDYLPGHLPRHLSPSESPFGWHPPNYGAYRRRLAWQRERRAILKEMYGRRSFFDNPLRTHYLYCLHHWYDPLCEEEPSDHEGIGLDSLREKFLLEKSLGRRPLRPRSFFKRSNREIETPEPAIQLFD